MPRSGQTAQRPPQCQTRMYHRSRYSGVHQCVHSTRHACQANSHVLCGQPAHCSIQHRPIDLSWSRWKQCLRASPPTVARHQRSPGSSPVVVFSHPPQGKCRPMLIIFYVPKISAGQGAVIFDFDLIVPGPGPNLSTKARVHDDAATVTGQGISMRAGYMNHQFTHDHLNANITASRLRAK